MKEFKLQANVAFYAFVGLVTFLLFLIATYASGYGYEALTHSIFIVLIAAIACVNFNLLMTISGKRVASFCANGLYYITLLGRRKYISGEEISDIKIKKICAISITHVQHNNGSIYFLSFQFTRNQELKLRQFGYLTSAAHK